MLDDVADPPNLMERLDQGRIKFELLGTPESLARLGRFVVFARIGSGGMGVIYHAYDPELDRGVAIKVLRPAFTARGGHRRLLREARAMARLAHPNVIQVFEVGEVEEHVFLIMEYVSGQTLRAWLAAQPRSWQEVLAVFLQAGAGLVATHAHGLVHCDFKPENVLIGADGRARVGDFGLVVTEADGREPPAIERLRAREHQPEAVSTSTSRIGGTPRYMAPEQLEGHAADPRSDQYSFCVALLEALAPTAFAEFTRDESIGARALRGERPPPLAVGPPGLAQALARGLDPDPAQRWPTLPELLLRLSRLAAPPRSRGWRWGLSSGLALGLIAGAGYGLATRDAPTCDSGAAQLTEAWGEPQRARLRAAFTATGLGFAADTSARVEAGLDSYADAWSAIYRDACEAHHRGEMSAELLDRTMLCLAADRGALAGLVERLVDLEAPEVERATRAVLRLPELARCRDAGVLLAEVAPPADPATAAAVSGVQSELAVVRSEWTLGRHDVAAQRAAAALVRAEALGHPPLIAQTLHQVGKLQQGRDARADAEASLTRAAFLAAEIGDDERLGLVAASLGQLVAQAGERGSEARVWARLARATTGRVAPRGRAHFEALLTSGQVEYLAGHLVEAGEWYIQALALAEAELGRESEPALVASDMLALTLGQRGEFAAALDRFDRNGVRQRELFGPNHPSLAVHDNNRATVLRQAGRSDEALAGFEQALAIWQAAYGPDHPDVAMAQGNIASALLTRGHAGDLEAAEPHLRRAIATREANFGPDDPDLAIELANLGNLHLIRLEPDIAEPLFTRALQIRERSVGPDNPLVVPPRTGLADAAALRGDLVAQAQQLRRILAVQERALGPDHPQLALPLWGLAEAALRGGDLELAGRLLDRADRLDTTSLGDVAARTAQAVHGQLARRRGDLAGACDLLARSLDGPPERMLEPTDIAWSFELALALAAAGRPAEARPLVDRAEAFYRRGGPALTWRVDECAALQRALGR